jgi:hypothetical protein
MAPCRASLLTLFVGVLLLNLMAVTQSVGEGVPTPTPLVLIPKFYIRFGTRIRCTIRGNGMHTSKVWEAQVQKRMKITAHALQRACAWEREKMLIKSGYF